MKILLVDDHALFIEGIKSLLMARGKVVIGTANDGFDGLQKARSLKPDVILMDVQMPRCNGLEATRLIKAEMPDVKIVMLTMSDDNDDLFEAIKCGASGYLLKNLNADEFLALLDGLEKGEAPLSRGLSARILQEIAGKQEAKKTGKPVEKNLGLTERQMEVLTLVAQGLTYKQVGEKLFLTERAIKYHMGEILVRLHLENRAQVIAYAARAGLIPPDESRVFK